MAQSTTSGRGTRTWEFPKGSGIRIAEVVNVHDGASFNGSFMVTIPAKLTGGARARKQFKNRALAEDHAEKAFKGFKKQGNDFFALTDQERREVALCLPLLRKHGLTLTEAVDFAVKRFSAVGKDKTFASISAELLASKEQRQERGDLRERSVRDFKHRVERFGSDEAFANRPACEITGQQLKDWINAQSLGPRSNKNYLNAAGEVFRFAVQKKYLTASPLEELTDVDRKELCGGSVNETEPAILTVDQAEVLLGAAKERDELGLLAAVTLGLFCGLRTEEIKRLQWESVRLHDSKPVVTIGAKIAKKRRIRHVDIPANALSWLSLCSKAQGPVAENAHTNDFQKRFKKLTAHAGITWENNLMRHSFGSYHYALNGNPLETSRLLGHKASDQVLFDHYRALATKEQAERYFALTPAQTGAKVVNGTFR